MSAVAAPTFPDLSTTGHRRDLLIGVGVGLALIASFVLAPVSGTTMSAARLVSAGRVLVAGIPVAVGVYASRGVPFRRLGRLLVATGLVWLMVTLSLSQRPFVFSLGRIAEWAGWAALLCLMLAFPDGRLVGRIDRSLAAAIAWMLALLWFPTALLVDSYPTQGDWMTCSSASCPHNAFMVVAHQPGLIESVIVPVRELLAVIVFLAVVARLLQRIVASSKIHRITLTPVLTVAVAGIVLGAFGLAARRLAPGSPSVTVARWLSSFALPATALAFLVGLLRWRLYVGASLSRFVASLRAPLGPEGVRAAFADAFDDPSLTIVYPVGDRLWASGDGRPADAPEASPGRSVTELRDRDDAIVAALVHDDALESETAFINSIGSYATLTLENNRLAADVASLLRDVRATQARAVESADRAREEIERNLHDGAQQRLVGLRIKLQLAADRAVAEGDAERLNRLGSEVQLAIDDLRSLARGVFTPVLTDLGPVAAIRDAVRDAPIPTTVTGRNVPRYSPTLERAVYFCCLEALQNVYKHARTATTARITIARRGNDLTIEVGDDGVGFDANGSTPGAGLQNMCDRLAALGGSLTIEAAPGHGARIMGTIPLTPELTAGARGA